MLNQNSIKNRIRLKISQIHENYTLDTTELGKVLTVASISILLISIPSALEYKNNYEDIEEINRGLDNMRGVMATEDFQTSMESIETTLSGSDLPGAGEFRQLYNSFDQMNSTLTELEQIESNMEKSYNTYQWIILISISGAVSGLALIYT